MVSRPMKDSGVEWIGVIPEHWSIKKTKRVFHIVQGGTPTTSNPDYWENGTIPWITPKNMNSLLNGRIKTSDKQITQEGLENSSAQIIPKKSIILSSRAPVGKVAKNDVPLSTNQGCKSLVPLSEELDADYYYYFFIIASEALNVISSGTTFVELSGNSLMNFYIPFPSPYEQQKIASFLDEKVAHIDNIIEDTKKSIEYLKAYKQSLITESVTKGLNPNVEMKDSEIEWIGEIPKHWETAFLNQYFRQVKNKNKNLKENNLLSLSYGNIVQKDINTKDGLLPKNFEGYNIIQKNDIVLRMTDLQNDKTSLRVGLATQTGIITSAYITIGPYNNIESRYAYYFLHSFDIYKGFYGMGSGVRQNVTFDMLKKLKILVPPLEEQEKIIEFIELKTSVIDNLIKNKEIIKNEFKEYKKSLIYEYVTGKKEVK